MDKETTICKNCKHWRERNYLVGICSGTTNLDVSFEAPEGVWEIRPGECMVTWANFGCNKFEQTENNG